MVREVVVMLQKFLIAGCVAVALCACASTAPSAGMAQAKSEDHPPAGCTYDTASRLPPTGPCGGVGSGYTNGDLSRTGQQNPNIGKALQMVNPSVQSHP
jgi:hypothetical protein